MLLSTTLAWTIERLIDVLADALRASSDADEDVRSQIEAATSLLKVEPILSAPRVRPAQPEILALRTAGTPWGAVAEVADELRAIDTSITDLAQRLLLPDDDIRWRLFHLGVLGILILELQHHGFKVKSLRPLGGSSVGPSYEVTNHTGKKWSLWFEAAGVWSHEGIIAPYSESTQGIEGAGLALGADIMLICPHEEALILECKYSNDSEVIGRRGYQQAVTYATEAKSRLAGKVVSVVVTPTGSISTPSFTDMVVGKVGTVTPENLSKLVADFFEMETFATQG